MYKFSCCKFGLYIFSQLQYGLSGLHLVVVVQHLYLVVWWCSLPPPTTASLLGPSWLAGGGLGAIVSVRGRGVAGVSATVGGSRARGCRGGILGPLLLTEDKRKTHKFWKKQLWHDKIYTVLIWGYNTFNAFSHILQVIVAFGFLLFPFFISFIITELQLGRVVNLLMSPCKRKDIRTRFVLKTRIYTFLYITYHPSLW